MVFPIISEWAFSVAMETRVLIQSAQQFNAASTPVMLHVKPDQDWLTRLRNIQVQKGGQRTMTDSDPLVYYKLTL